MLPCHRGDMGNSTNRTTMGPTAHSPTGSRFEPVFDHTPPRHVAAAERAGRSSTPAGWLRKASSTAPRRSTKFCSSATISPRRIASSSTSAPRTSRPPRGRPAGHPCRRADRFAGGVDEMQSRDLSVGCARNARAAPESAGGLHGAQTGVAIVIHPSKLRLTQRGAIQPVDLGRIVSLCRRNRIWGP